MDVIKRLIYNIGDWFIDKTSLLFSWLSDRIVHLFVWLSVFLTPLIPSMIIIMMFIIIDYFLGIQASKKQGIEITSRRRKDTITKTLAYQCSLIVAHLIEVFFLPDFPVLKIIEGYIVYVEVTSIDEKNKILTGKSILKEIIKKFPKLNSNKEK